MRQCSIIQTFFVTKYSWRLVAEISYELFGRDFVDIWTLFVFLRVWYLYFAWIIYWGQRKCNLFSCYRTVIASFAIVFMLLSYYYYSGVSLYYFQVVELIERTIELHLTSIRLWLVITLYPRETFDNGGLLVSHPASAIQVQSQRRESAIQDHSWYGRSTHSTEPTHCLLWDQMD